MAQSVWEGLKAMGKALMSKMGIAKKKKAKKDTKPGAVDDNAMKRVTDHNLAIKKLDAALKN